jgi:phospho-N-acetylmuramoyl-pentapeptide-transferase
MEGWSQFAVGLVAASVAACIVYPLLLRLQVRQTVSQHVQEHAHKQGTPTMGGLIFVIGSMAALLLVSSSTQEQNLAAAITIGMFATLGFVDDFVVPRFFAGKRGLGWGPKLALQAALAGIVVLASGANSTNEWKIACFVSILFFANAYNFADGLDWLAGSLAYPLFLALPFLAGASWIGVTGAVLGAMVPFMVLNRPKARLFMGDTGSLPLGALLGLGAAAAMPLGPDSGNLTMAWVALALWSVVMLIELVPVPLQILSVKLRGKRLFPMTPIHHAFQKAGWPETRIVSMFFFVQLVASLAAVALGAGRVRP